MRLGRAVDLVLALAFDKAFEPIIERRHRHARDEHAGHNGDDLFGSRRHPNAPVLTGTEWGKARKKRLNSRLSEPRNRNRAHCAQAWLGRVNVRGWLTERLCAKRDKKFARRITSDPANQNNIAGARFNAAGPHHVWPRTDRGRPGPDRHLRRPSALQPGADAVLSAREGAGDFPAQRRDRNSRDQPPEQGHASTHGRESAGPVGGAFHPPLPHPRRHPDLVQRRGHLRSHSR